MIEKFPIQEYFAIDMLRHGIIGILYIVNNLTDRFIFFDVLKQFFKDEVESLVR